MNSAEDSLRSVNLSEYLRTSFLGRKMIYFDTLDSTNAEARKKAHDEPQGTVIISEQQTAGRGRFGRDWLSPKGLGIWMSLILKPDLPPEEIPQLTLIAAAAVCLAVEEAGIDFPGKGLTIKWPNDIFLNGKKTGGILTEMQMGDNRIPNVVVGIGLNVNLRETDFPDSLLETATSFRIATGACQSRPKIAVGILNAYESLYLEYLKNGHLGQTLAICRERSEVIGKEVVLEGRDALSQQGYRQLARVLDLGPKGELIAELENGEIISVFSGEVSLKINADTQ